MKGFDDKALILFPKWENYNNKSVGYKYQFKRAVSNLVSYLESVSIAPHVFYTDDVARDINNESFVFVSTLNKTDRYFISKNCDGCSDALTCPMISFDDVYNDILAKDPGSLDMSVNERFEMIIRHTNKAASKIIPMYKIVVHFLIPSKSQYKVTTKPGDGKIRITVSANTFTPKAYLSGSEENICDLLNLSCASRSLDKWG